MIEVKCVDVAPEQFSPEQFLTAFRSFLSYEPLLYESLLSSTTPALTTLTLPLKLYVHGCLGSTSDRLRELLEQGEPGGTAVLALTQTQGRGQQGRTWASEAGGLYFSWGIEPDLPATEGARLSLGSAWGLAQVFQQQNIPVGLKWPNDLLLTRKKLGGLLTETRLKGGRIYRAMVGVGLNWNNPAPAPGISLKPFLRNRNPSRITSLEGLTALVWVGLLAGCNRWCFSDIPLREMVNDYENLVKVSGRPVQIGSEWGMITGIATTGELKVNCKSQELLFPPGAISLGYDYD